MANYLLPALVFSTIFERLNIFIPALDFSLKLSLVILPIAALALFIRKRLTFNPTFLFPFLAFLIIAEVLSILSSFDPFQSLQVAVFHLLMIGLFYLIVWSVRNWRDLTRLVWAWGIGSGTIALLGVWQFFRYAGGRDPALFFERWFSARTLPVDTFLQSLYGITDWRFRWDTGLIDHFLRPPSTFIDVSTGASFVGIFLILGLGWFLAFPRKDLRRVLMGGLMAVSSLYFLMAVSRSAVLGLAAGLLVFAFLMIRRWMGSGRSGILTLIVAAVILFGGVQLSERFLVRSASDSRRLEYASAAVEMVKERPLFGVGAGNFEPYYKEVLEPGSPAGYPHSIFLSWLGELGVVGLSANLLLIAAVFLFIGRVIKTIPYDSVIYVRLSALAAAFAGLVGANIFHAHYGLEFTWVLLGLSVSGYYLARGESSAPAGEQDVLGVKVDSVTVEEAIARVKEIFKSGKRGYVVTPNPEMVVQAQRDGEFREILNRADLAVPDGAGLVWASRIWGTPLRERVAGTDLFEELCAEASRRGGRIFLLGAQPGVAERAAEDLKKRYPKLRVAGAFAGNGSPAGDGETVGAVKKAAKGRRIDLLFVAYGHGKQERWINRNLKKLPVKVAMGVGGAFDFAAGEQVRAPGAVRALGFEWLYRLLRQPRRAGRQRALIPFIFLSFKESFRR